MKNLFIIAAVLFFPQTLLADVVVETANLSYSPAVKTWAFTTATAGGSINIAAQALGNRLTKLKDTGLDHTCLIEYDKDSKMESLNGIFYSSFKIST